MVSLVGVSECFILPLTENGCDQHLCLVIVSGYFVVSIFVVSELVFALVVVSGYFVVSVFVVSEWVFSLVVVSGCFAVSVFVLRRNGCFVCLLVVVSEYLLFLSQRVAVMGAFRMFCISFRTKWLQWCFLPVIFGCVGSIRFPVTVVTGDTVQWTGY